MSTINLRGFNYFTPFSSFRLRGNNESEVLSAEEENLHSQTLEIGPFLSGAFSNHDGLHHLVTPLNNPGGPEGDTVTVDEQRLRKMSGMGRFGSAALWGRARRGLGAVRGRGSRLRGRWSFSPAGFRRAWPRGSRSDRGRI